MVIRIQRKRIKGWRMPENTVYVGRGTKWGNPYKVGGTVENHFGRTFEIKNNKQAVNAYTNMFLASLGGIMRREPYCDVDFSELRGKNLACWCRLDEPCHADVLLKLANEEPQ
jgi:hypothetical protein